MIREFRESDIEGMLAIWNEVVEEGIAFPQEETFDRESGLRYFRGQTFCGVAEDRETGTLYGLYTLHPNNVGRCGHICNASYAVASGSRGLHIGEKLVKHCVAQARAEGFRILQFNAVVATNLHARHLYERLGFTGLGTVPGGFRLKDGRYEAICPYYIVLDTQSAAR
jgi:L-amino acid N-acyltransferase YncA